MAFVRQTQMGAGADEVRAYRQPQDRQGARSRRAALTAWTSRQGDRIEMPFAAAHESVRGTNRTWPNVRFEFASLIGRLGSSAFRLSTTTVSMSLAGSCFSSEIGRPRALVWGFFCQGVRQSGQSFVLRQFLCSISKPVSSSRPAGSLTSSRAGAVEVGRRANLAATKVWILVLNPPLLRPIA